MSTDRRESSPAPTGVRRRDALVGGVAGLAGLAAGAVAGRLTAPTRSGTPEVPPQPPFPADANPSYAQCGEDLVMTFLLRHFKVEQPSYLDIGCWEPVRSNNTYLFYLRGGRGVLVEPNPALADRIRELRPEDRLVTAGIGVTDAAEADYYMFNEPQLNTFDPEEIKRLATQPHIKLEQTIKLPLVNINRVIGEQLGKTPDVVSIDIEGLDLAVLRTLDFDRYRPRMVCAETQVAATLRHNPETVPFMASKGYEVRGLTFANTIFLDKRMSG